MGQESLQITGEIREEALSSKPDIAEEDIKTVMEQAGVDRHKALQAIEDAEGLSIMRILSGVLIITSVAGISTC